MWESCVLDKLCPHKMGRDASCNAQPIIPCGTLHKYYWGSAECVPLLSMAWREVEGHINPFFILISACQCQSVKACVPLIKNIIVPLPICLGVLVKIPMLRLVSVWNLFHNTDL